MQTRREVSIEMRELIVKMRSDEKSYAEIARTIKMPRSTVASIVQKYTKMGIMENKARSGRPRKLEARTKRLICREIVTIALFLRHPSARI